MLLIISQLLTNWCNNAAQIVFTPWDWERQTSWWADLRLNVVLFHVWKVGFRHLESVFPSLCLHSVYNKLHLDPSVRSQPYMLRGHMEVFLTAMRAVSCLVPGHKAWPPSAPPGLCPWWCPGLMIPNEVNQEVVLFQCDFWFTFRMKLPYNRKKHSVGFCLVAVT